MFFGIFNDIFLRDNCADALDLRLDFFKFRLLFLSFDNFKVEELLILKSVFSFILTLSFILKLSSLMILLFKLILALMSKFSSVL